MTEDDGLADGASLGSNEDAFPFQPGLQYRFCATTDGGFSGQ